MIRTRLWLLAAALVAVIAVHAWNGVHGNDFWEHLAVVRELAAHPLHPHHPLLRVDAPHAFFSPYAVLLGVATHTSGARPASVLAAAGLVNLILVIMGVIALTRALSREGDRAAFYALLCILFLWGADPWLWSGFLHFAALGTVAPYPSTFAIGLTLIALAAYAAVVDDVRPRSYAALAACGAVILLTHPPTALAFYSGLAALHVGRAQRYGRSTVLLAVTLAASIPLAALWPYFPILDLLRSPAAFNAASRDLYQHVWSRTWPIAAVAPLVVLVRLRESRRDALVLWAGALLAIFALGRWRQSYGVGRLIAFVAIAVQLGFADLLARGERTAEQRSRGIAAALPVVAVVLALTLPSFVAPVLERCDPRRPAPPSPLAFLERIVGDDDVVLADLGTSWMLPAYAGKTVASRRPLYWIADHEARRRDSRRFFDDRAGAVERREILRRWDVRFVLLDVRRVGAANALVTSLAAARIVATSGPFVLIDTRG